MKIKLYTILTMTAMAVAITSCGDEYWESGYPTGDTYAFPKPAYTVNVSEGAEIPTSIDILMTRNNRGAEATVPVEAVFSNPSLQGGTTVTFAAGSNTGVYTIHVDPAIAGGSTFKASLKLADDYYSGLDTIHNKCQLTLTTPFAWADAGTAQVASAWVGNMSDGASSIAVPVQRATNYVGDGKMYRLQSLYYNMEPDYAEEGYGIQFILDNDGNPVKLSPSIQQMGESDKSYGDFAIGCWTGNAYNTSFTKSGNIYTIVAQILYNAGTTGWYLAGQMEYIQFTWSPTE